MVSPFLLQREQGGNSSNPIVWDMSGLGHANSSLPIYMTVGIIPTSFEFKANQWATIRVNGRPAVEFCTPQLSCSGEWYYCAYQMPVYELLNSTIGGQLRIEVSVTGVESGPCDHKGYPLYAMLVLSETFVPQQASPPEPVHVMFIVVPIVLLLLLLLLVYLVDKVVAYHKANDKYKVRQPVDVEVGMENLDPDERAVRGSNSNGAPSLQAVPLHKLHRQWTISHSKNIKVLPIEEDSDPEGNVKVVEEGSAHHTPRSTSPQ
jgi:hypothetical protein